ncbi:MAG: acetylglutamate kinase [Victivallales bacterium]|nr:acetylglutamate kinase [Victivallales bacterium]
MIDKAAVLIEALPYIQKFRGAVVVIKFGGSAMEDPDLMKKTMRDIVFMECVGMKPIVVHGGGKAISAKLAELGIETKFINGLRYTCEKTIGVVDDVLHNDINKSLLAAVNAAGGDGITLSGKTFLKAAKTTTADSETGETLDLGFVGEIVDIDTNRVLEAVDLGTVPVIPPLGVDETGQTYNINADIAACEIAMAIGARKLVFLSDVPGILQNPDDDDSIIPTVTVDEVDSLIEHNIITGGMAPKIKSAEAALRYGVAKVHIIDGRIKHSLMLEIFTDTGIGTEIVQHREKKWVNR